MSVATDVRIVTGVPRTPETLLGTLRGLDLATFGHLLEEGFAQDLRCITGAQTLTVGRVLTVKLVSTDSRIVHYATRLIGDSDFVVIDNGHNRTHASVGGGVAAALAARGAVGVAVSGTVTDIVELRESGLAVFATGLAPLTTRSSAGPIQGSINVPISVGGVTVHPGMIAMADENGVLFAPSDTLAAHVERVQSMMAWEPSIMEQVRSGIALGDLILDAEDIRELDSRSEQSGAAS